jgi:hypothetical protein
MLSLSLCSPLAEIIEHVRMEIVFDRVDTRQNIDQESNTNLTLIRIEILRIGREERSSLDRVDPYLQECLMHAEDRCNDLRDVNMNDTEEIVAFFQFTFHIGSEGIEK